MGSCCLQRHTNLLLHFSIVAPEWLRDLLGWRPATSKSEARCRALFGLARAPNIADVGGRESLRIAGAIFESLGIPHTQCRAELSTETGSKSTSSGTSLERGIEADLESALPILDPGRKWSVSRSGLASSFAQFRHLGALQELFDNNPALRTAAPRDYQVKSDIHVGVDRDGSGPELLHAAVSCKWTIRSDRVQNVRHEFATLVRNRRGRLPHLVLVTAEPLPSRLISIARGTGEVDAVYHLLFDVMETVLPECGTTEEQLDHWRELVEQERVKSYGRLVKDLVTS